MNRKLSVLALAIAIVFIFTSSAFASFFVQRINVGYSYLFLDELVTFTEDDLGEIGKHHFYSDSISLLGLSKVDHLHLGFKTASSFGLKTVNEDMNLLTTSAVSGIIDYTYPISEAFSIGANATIGINILGLISRASHGNLSFGDFIKDRNYISIWRPYFQVGAGLSVEYNLGYLTSLSLSAGYNFNLAITPWLDLFSTINNSKDTQKIFHSLFVTFGAGLSF